MPGTYYITLFSTFPLSHHIVVFLLFSKCFERLEVTDFNKSIYNYVFGRYKSIDNFFKYNFFFDPVLLYLNVFGVPIKVHIYY